jgi:hypothetical protein
MNYEETDISTSASTEPSQERPSSGDTKRKISLSIETIRGLEHEEDFGGLGGSTQCTKVTCVCPR